MDIAKHKKELAKNLRVERARNKITQQQLSILSEVSIETIKRIERELANPRLDTLVAIALALKVDLNTLLPLR